MLDEPRLKALEIYHELKRIHDLAFTCMQRMKDGVRQKQDPLQIVDMIAVLKQADIQAKSLRTEIGATLSKLQELSCKLYLLSNELGEPIRTDWVTGTPDVKVKPSLPTLKDNPQGYLAMCKDLGLPENVAKMDVFRPYYPTMETIVSACQARGETLPPWVRMERTGSEFTVRCLWKKDVDIDDLTGELSNVN